jgi:hypothetical protein
LAVILELLRIEQGEGQITQQQNGQDEGYDCDNVHWLPQLLAGFDVEKRQPKENHGEQQHPNVLHGISRNRLAKTPPGQVFLLEFTPGAGYAARRFDPEPYPS